jgi:DNA-binding PadR family transcriptional regulator
MTRGTSEKYRGKSSAEMGAFLLSFCNVRILNYASKEPIHAAEILERLHGHGCIIAAEIMNRMLLRMVRDGLLKAKTNSARVGPTGRRYALTRQGQKILALTRRRLGSLIEKFDPY